MLTYDFHDCPSDSNFGQYDVLVTDYEDGYYDGSGSAIALQKDGTVSEYDCGHCSCYGPGDGGPNYTWKTFEEFLANENALDGNTSSEMNQKFIQLVQEFKSVRN